MGLKGFPHRVLEKIVQWALAPLPRTYATCGANVKIAEPFAVNYSRRLFLGCDIYIGPNACFNSVGGIRIGDGCVIGPFLHVYSSNHKYEGSEALPFDEQELFGPVDIAKNVWIGGDVIILPGVTVGEGAVIAAGAVVVKDVPPGAVVAGLPARQIKQRDMDNYHKLVREGKILNAMVGSGKNRPKPIGKMPAKWYEEAGLTPIDLPPRDWP